MEGPLRKRHRCECENEENSITSEFRPIPKKWVCRYCKREFMCGRGLGGHIKVHFKNRRETKFYRKKQSRKRIYLQSSSAYAATVAPQHTRRTVRYQRKDKEKKDGRCSEIIDLSMSLSGFGWKGQRMRGGIERRLIVATDFDDDDEDGEGDSFVRERLRRCGVYDFSAHHIYSTRQYVCTTCNMVLPTFHAVLCHINENGSSINNGDDDGEEAVVEEGGEIGGGEEGEGVCDRGDVEGDMGAKQEEEVGDDGHDDGDEEEEEEEELEEKAGDGEASMEVDEVADAEEQEEEGAKTTKADKVADKEGRMSAKACTQVDDEVAKARDNSGSMGPPRMLDFDLNEMPPEEED